MRPTFHQLELFREVARQGSFTKAAKKLSIAQPTVSGQIKQLSQGIGLPLFEKVGRQLFLTEAGEMLLDSCREMFDSLDRLEMAMADLQGQRRGRLKLAVVTTAQYVVPKLLGEFCQEYPDVDVALRVLNHAQLSDRMGSNADDLYVLSHIPEHVDLEFQPFVDNSLMVVAGRSHPLALQAMASGGREKIPIQKLANQDFVMREPGSGTRRAVEEHFARHKLSVQVRLDLSTNEAIAQAVASGLGMAVLSRHCLASGITNPDLVPLEVEHFPIRCQWYVAHLKAKQLSVVAESFRDRLLHYDEFSEHQLIGSPSLVMS
ncbi:MAG: LysR family transcriptional regulator [Cyanobacteria bacterium P01_C01_bin.89]